MTEGWKQNLLDHYVDRGALAVGHFDLVGGGVTDFYIDGRMVTTSPVALELIAQQFARTIEEEQLLDSHDTIVAPALSGVPILVALSLKLGIPYVIDRGRPKQHGMGKRFEGAFRSSDRCLVIDDLITAGTTLTDTIAALRADGRVVEDALIVVDREEGGVEALAADGVKIRVLITKAELRAVWEESRCRAEA
jgi:orotate phosphoribosyltransferase